MKVTDYTIGSFTTDAVTMILYENPAAVPDPGARREVCRLPLADVSVRTPTEYEPRWKVPDFEVKPGLLYCFYFVDGANAGLCVLRPEGLRCLEAETMTMAAWQVAAGGESWRR